MRYMVVTQRGRMVNMKIYGHRGSMGKYPQNTLLSFQKAIEQGADGIEIDIHLSKDGEVVVIHDETLEGTTNGSGYVKDHSLEELKRLDAGLGQQIPTLSDVFKLLSGTNTELNIELKTYKIRYEGIEEKALFLAKEHGEGRKIVYSSFHLPTILRIKRLDNSADIAWLMGSPFLSHPQDYIQTLELDALHLWKDMVLNNPDHYRGVCDKLRIWTVNDEDEMKKLIDLGVGAIITDFPDKAVALNRRVPKLHNASADISGSMRFVRS